MSTTYQYEHYQDSLTLNEIAASANISRSKCCIIFKRYLQLSPVEFLNKYRLEVSRYLLIHTHSSISQIAISCGFNHLSYFSKLFLREYGCTPTKYRKNCLQQEDVL
ncbi:MAG: helix-turn-helix transcriptional regulator [bacterium]|nr:helix-turn-helix transcriptional regulator [bacterium]